MSDTRKQIWKFQEGAVVLALRECCGESKVHWDHTPKGMSIDPDVVVGDIPDSPEVVIFVTHASAAREGTHKFWRTMAEVVDAKRLSSKPQVISVLFPSNMKKKLLSAYGVLFDKAIHLDDISWGNLLSNSLATLNDEYGGLAKEVCLQKIADSVEAGGIPNWRDFASNLKDALTEKRGIYDKTISSSSFNSNSRVPRARETTLRRSMCKYYTFHEPIRSSLKSGVNIKEPPQHAVILGWVSKTIGGYRLTDPEFNQFLSSSDSDVLSSVVRHIDARIPVFQEYVSSLQNVEGTLAAFEWVVNNYSLLKKPAGMLAALQDVFNDPITPLEQRISSDLIPTDHWLFSSIMILLRTETGRKDGYGYSTLGDEVDEIRFDLLALPFLQRTKNLEATTLKTLSKVFSEHLLRLSESRTKELFQQSLSTHMASIFNFKLMNYRHYNPVDWVVCDVLASIDQRFDHPSQHPSFLSQAGMGTTTSTGNMISVDGGRVWIKCQSAYAGKIDKRKELCGRIGAMKLCYTPEELDQKKFLLVIDGFFEDRDLALLDQAGWDGIFYYDEMDALKKAIV
ncbi:hypothetical protein N8703_03265 [Verrucomicrobia bacterium]|nr:hypothetical protein [Verrucomicrobiota bacterium]